MTHRPEPMRCAVRLPGEGQASVADSPLDVDAGQWVVVETGAGEEAARVVIGTGQWLSDSPPEPKRRIIRLLEEHERTSVAAQLQRSIELTETISSALQDLAPGLIVSGLRFNLAGDRATASLIGSAPEDETEIVERLTQIAGVPVLLEATLPVPQARGFLGGGIGSPGRPYRTVEELVRHRLDAISMPGTFAPQGVPRLGTRVDTPQGPGLLVAVDIRHGMATVLMDEDTREIEIPVEDLTEESA